MIATDLQEGEGEFLFNKYGVSIREDEKTYRNGLCDRWLYNNRNVLNDSELYT